MQTKIDRLFVRLPNKKRELQDGRIRPRKDQDYERCPFWLYYSKEKKIYIKHRNNNHNNSIGAKRNWRWERDDLFVANVFSPPNSAPIPPIFFFTLIYPTFFFFKRVVICLLYRPELLPSFFIFRIFFFLPSCSSTLQLQKAQK